MYRLVAVAKEAPAVSVSVLVVDTYATPKPVAGAAPAAKFVEEVIIGINPPYPQSSRAEPPVPELLKETSTRNATSALPEEPSTKVDTELATG